MSQCCSTYPNGAHFTAFFHRRTGQVRDGPVGPISNKMTHLHKLFHKFFSLLKCHFLFPLLPCPFAQVLNRHTIVCWSGASIPPPVSTSSLMEARGKRAICLEQHSHFYTKIAETEKRCADLCKIHSRTLMDAIDCNLLAKFQGGTSMGTAFHLVVVFVAVVIFGAQSLYSDKHL